MEFKVSLEKEDAIAINDNDEIVVFLPKLRIGNKAKISTIHKKITFYSLTELICSMCSKENIENRCTWFCRPLKTATKILGYSYYTRC